MGKLRSLKPRLSTMGARLGRAPEDEPDRHRRRDAEQPWRRWYKTKRWQDLRASILVRDGYVCQATGVLLVGKHPAPNSPVVDHKRPHRGDADLFWDPANLQAVSKEYHDGAKQRQERRAS